MLPRPARPIHFLLSFSFTIKRERLKTHTSDFGSTFCNSIIYANVRVRGGLYKVIGLFFSTRANTKDTIWIEAFYLKKLLNEARLVSR